MFQICFWYKVIQQWLLYLLFCTNCKILFMVCHCFAQNIQFPRFVSTRFANSSGTCVTYMTRCDTCHFICCNVACLVLKNADLFTKLAALRFRKITSKTFVRLLIETLGPFNYHGLALIPPSLHNCTPGKVWIITRLQSLHCWNVGMEKVLLLALCNWCYYLSMPQLKFNRVSKRVPYG